VRAAGGNARLRATAGTSQFKGAPQSGALCAPRACPAHRRARQGGRPCDGGVPNRLGDVLYALDRRRCAWCLLVCARPPPCAHAARAGEWRDVAMEASSVPGWRSVTVQAAGAVEFVMKDGAGRWDNPLGVSGRNYVAACAGKYKLQASELLLLPPNLPVLLVRLTPPPPPPTRPLTRVGPRCPTWTAQWWATTRRRAPSRPSGRTWQRQLAPSSSIQPAEAWPRSWSWRRTRALRRC